MGSYLASKSIKKKDCLIISVVFQKQLFLITNGLKKQQIIICLFMHTLPSTPYIATAVLLLLLITCSVVTTLDVRIQSIRSITPRSHSEIHYEYKQEPDHTHCASTGEIHSSHHAARIIKSNSSDPQSDTSKVCYKYHECDEQSVRDQYATPHNKMFQAGLEIIILNDNSPFFNSIDNIAPVILSELNTHFESANIIFDATIIKVALPTESSSSDTLRLGTPQCKSTPEIPCISPYELLESVFATSTTRKTWKQRGVFQVVIGDLQDAMINGFANFPWNSLHGSVVLSKKAFKPGYTTLTHELAHGFGLYHTFRGISEIGSCQDRCYENEPSPFTGDLVEDTPPVAMNWECEAPDIRSYPDPCNAKRASWAGAKQNNFMAYSSMQNCRQSFTELQKRRMRCFAESFVGSRNATYSVFFNSATSPHSIALQFLVITLLLICLLQ